MKRWFLGCFLIIGFVSSIFSQNINTPANFPDPNFRAAVEDFMGVLPGGDFTALEAANKTGMFNCVNRGITNITGLAFFTGITGLDCSQNQLAQLDVSLNQSLQSLDCESNQLTHLDVSLNQSLQALDCNFNQITQLDVSPNPVLYGLDCNNNLLTQLDVSQIPELQYLGCSFNQLTQLNVSPNINLLELYCDHNQLIQLDVSANTVLQILNCQHNQILSVSSLVANSGLGAGDTVDVRWNFLDYGDWNEVQTLKSQIGDPVFISFQGVDFLVSGFAYIPQNIPTSFIYKVHWTGDVGDFQKDAYFQAILFSPPINSIAQFPAWCTDMTNLIDLDKPYPGPNPITHPAPVLYSSFGQLPPAGQGVVDNPNNLPNVNWILNEYRAGSFNNIDFDSNGQTESASWREVQAAIWKYLYNNMLDVTPIGDITSGFITWNDPFAKWIYQQALGHGNFIPNTSGQVIGIIVYLGGDIQTTLCEVPYEVSQFLQLLGLLQ